MVTSVNDSTKSLHLCAKVSHLKLIVLVWQTKTMSKTVQLLSAYKLEQARSTLPVQSTVADSQSKRAAGGVKVFVEHLARETDILRPN